MCAQRDDEPPSQRTINMGLFFVGFICGIVACGMARADELGTNTTTNSAPGNSLSIVWAVDLEGPPELPVTIRWSETIPTDCEVVDATGTALHSHSNLSGCTAFVLNGPYGDPRGEQADRIEAMLCAWALHNAPLHPKVAPAFEECAP